MFMEVMVITHGPISANKSYSEYQCATWYNERSQYEKKIYEHLGDYTKCEHDYKIN